MMSDPPGGTRRFAGWLEASMRSRGLTQAQLARSVGVADTQVSRWRRGQVVPTLQYLQRLADTFGVERITLDELVGLPIAQARRDTDAPIDPEQEAELQAYQARFREVLQTQLPRGMWRAYLEACVALADGLSASARRVVRQSIEELNQDRGPKEPPPDRPLGFRP
jgi:transcriptional regulator with XRE-family HTH domain